MGARLAPRAHAEPNTLHVSRGQVDLLCPAQCPLQVGREQQKAFVERRDRESLGKPVSCWWRELLGPPTEPPAPQNHPHPQRLTRLPASEAGRAPRLPRPGGEATAASAPPPACSQSSLGRAQELCTHM